MISSALTVSPMKIATMTDMKIYTGRLEFCSKVYDGLETLSSKYLMMKARKRASTGASSRVMARYWVSESLARMSRVTKTMNCFSLPGVRRVISGMPFPPLGCGGRSSFRDLKYELHSAGDTFRVIVGRPNSSSTFDSTMLNICSGLTLPQAGHTLSLYLGSSIRSLK